MIITKKIMFVDHWNGLSDEEKEKQYKKINAKYSTHIPVVVLNDADIDIEKNKFLVNGDITMGQFMFTIRKKVKLKGEEALFLFLEDDHSPPNSELMSVIYNRHRSKCGFLIMKLKKESVFG